MAATGQIKIGTPTAPMDRAAYDGAMEYVRSVLGADAVAQAWTSGQMLWLERTILNVVTSPD